MAISINNPLTRGLSGMLGKVIVFRNLRGRTILANRPCKPRRQSALQEENRHRFREATVFAKAAMKDPQQKEYYWSKARKLKLPNAYTAAITDYMRRPVVSRLAATEPSSDQPGLLTFTARKKDFRVASAEVMFRDARGNVLIRHQAVGRSNHEDQWTAPLPDRPLWETPEIIITLKDQAGNDYRIVSDYRQSLHRKGAKDRREIIPCEPSRLCASAVNVIYFGSRMRLIRSTQSSR